MSEKVKDEVLVLAKKDDGDKMLVSRRRDGEVTVGEATKLKDGAPLPSGGEIVYLKESKVGNPLYDVVDSYKLPGADSDPTESSGPAMVTSPAFRANWDSVFGGGDEQLN